MNCFYREFVTGVENLTRHGSHFGAGDLDIGKPRTVDSGSQSAGAILGQLEIEQVVGTRRAEVDRDDRQAEARSAS